MNSKRLIDPIRDQINIDQYKGRYKRFSLIGSGERNNYLRKFIAKCIDFSDGSVKGNIPDMQIGASKAAWDEYWCITIHNVSEEYRYLVVDMFNATPLPNDFIMGRIKWDKTELN